jgi:hypothetical protein
MRMWDSVKAAAAGVEDDGSYEKPAGPEDSAARRAAAFRTTAHDLGLPDDGDAGPYGVIVEFSGDGGTTTLIAFATGAASLLTDAGGGIIGQPNHVHVVVQAKRLVQAAAPRLALLAPAPAESVPPPPPAGAVRFHVLTRTGRRTAEAGFDDLRAGAHPLSPLLADVDELMSEFLQYSLPDSLPVTPPTAADWLKVLLMVAVIAGLTVAAWFIPSPWLRWPALAIGGFFTIAALIIPYAMLRAPRQREGDAA